MPLKAAAVYSNFTAPVEADYGACRGTWRGGRWAPDLDYVLTGLCALETVFEEKP